MILKKLKKFTKKILILLKKYQQQKIQFHQNLSKHKLKSGFGNQAIAPSGNKEINKIINQKKSKIPKESLKLRKNFKSGNTNQKKYIIIFVIIHGINILLVGGFFIYLVFWLKARGFF